MDVRLPHTLAAVLVGACLGAAGCLPRPSPATGSPPPTSSASKRAPPRPSSPRTPILAQRLAGPTRIPVLGSAPSGAALIAAADALGRVVAPVGVVISVLGGPFLLWVLFRPDRTVGKA